MGIVLFAALAAPVSVQEAWAEDIALPAREPAVTATLPDDWDTSVYEAASASAGSGFRSARRLSGRTS